MLKNFLRWIRTSLKNTFTYDGRLKLPPRPVLWIYGLLMAALVLGSVPRSGSELYVWPLVLLAIGLIGAIWLYVLSMICSVMIPDLVSMFRQLWQGIRRIPAAARACAGGIASAWHFVIGVPARWRAMSAEDKSQAKFMAAFMAVVFTVGYFLWPVAYALHSRLPNWMQMHEWWMGTLFIDTLLSVISISILTPIIATAVRLIRRRS